MASELRVRRAFVADAEVGLARIILPPQIPRPEHCVALVLTRNFNEPVFDLVREAGDSLSVQV